MKKKVLRFVYPTLLIIVLILLSNFAIIPNLNENQTLYFSSTLAQVSATLFGLIITAYTFLQGKLTKDAENDDSFIDIANELLDSYRQILLMGCILTGIALFLCIGNIFVGDYSKLVIEGVEYKFLRLLLNNSFTFSMSSIFCSLYFTYKATDPKRIEKANRKVVKENKYASKLPSADNEKNFLAEFIINYNKLEQQINSFVCDRKNLDCTRPILSKNIYYLRNTGVIENKLFVRLQEIRQFRNSLVHGANPFVSESTFYILMQLIEEANEAINDYKEN